MNWARTRLMQKQCTGELANFYLIRVALLKTLSSITEQHVRIHIFICGDKDVRTLRKSRTSPCHNGHIQWRRLEELLQLPSPSTISEDQAPARHAKPSTLPLVHPSWKKSRNSGPWWQYAISYPRSKITSRMISVIHSILQALNISNLLVLLKRSHFAYTNPIHNYGKLSATLQLHHEKFICFVLCPGGILLWAIGIPGPSKDLTSWY